MQGQGPGTGDAQILRPFDTKVRALKEKMPDLVILASLDPKIADALRGVTTGLRRSEVRRAVAHEVKA